MDDFYLVYILGLCAFIIYIDNYYPNAMTVIRKKFIKNLKKYWKALKEYDSGN